MRDTDTADQVLKPRIASQRVKSGIHPEPWHSSRPLKEPLLQGFKGFLRIAQLHIGIRDQEPADITFLGLFQGFT